MFPVDAPDHQSYERRRTHRVRLAVPVHVCGDAVGEGHALYSYAGQSQDLSLGGIYLRTRQKVPFVPGQMVRLSISIPPESRRLFQFSRVAGSCHVMRVESLPTNEEGLGVALAFGADTTFLGATVRS